MQEFLQVYATEQNYKESTKNEYQKTFKSLAKTFNTDDFKTLFTENYPKVIRTLQEKYPNNTNYWSKVNTFCRYYDIPYQEIPLTNKKKHVETINIHNIRHLISKISDTDDLKAKVFLSLLTNESQKSVRRDWANVMIKERCSKDELDKADAVYSNGVFEFVLLNKTYRSLTFTVKEDLQDLIHKYLDTIPDSKYLYTYTSKSQHSNKARTSSYTQYLQRITAKYLGKQMTTNDFRKAMVQGDIKDIMNSDKSEIEKLQLAVESAKGKDHNIETELGYYTNAIDNTKRNASTQTESFTTADSVLALVHMGYTVSLNK